VRVNRRLYVAPLVPLVGRGDGALVVVASREEGRFYRLRDGRLEEVTDLSDEQPRRHDQGGWSQARFQRRVDELAADHLREVAEELDRLVRRAHGNVEVVVFSPEESWAEFSGHLSQHVRKALAGWSAGEAHASAAELLERATPILEQSRAARERELLERWREETGRSGRAAAGWEATLQAASDARVEILLVSDGADRVAWRCPACGRASAREGTCPLDGTPMEQLEKGVDAAVHQTLVHGGTVWVAEHSQDLDPVEGIGALLRF
jgi:peptide chain release factor subunit 1